MTTGVRQTFALLAILQATLAALGGEAAGNRDKPLELGEIAYTGGAFTPDSRHFVYAIVPKDKSGSELRAADTASGKVESLGFMPLLRQPGAGPEDFFRWSLGVLGAENNLSAVYAAQYGPNADLDTKSAVAWGVKEKAFIPNTLLPKLDAAANLPVPPKLALNDLDAQAAEKRKAYQPIETIPALAGNKELAIETAGNAVKVDVTAAFKELYAAAVADYPNNKLPFDSGNVLVSDSIEPLAQCGDWVFLHCGFYAHYGIHGRGYNRLCLVNTATRRVLTYPGIGSHSASGLRTGPIDYAFLRAPDGKSVVHISNGRVTLYRLPSE